MIVHLQGGRRKAVLPFLSPVGRHGVDDNGPLRPAGPDSVRDTGRPAPELPRATRGEGTSPPKAVTRGTSADGTRPAGLQRPAMEPVGCRRRRPLRSSGASRYSHLGSSAQDSRGLRAATDRIRAASRVARRGHGGTGSTPTRRSDHHVWPCSGFRTCWGSRHHPGRAGVYGGPVMAQREAGEPLGQFPQGRRPRARLGRGDPSPGPSGPILPPADAGAGIRSATLGRCPGHAGPVLDATGQSGVAWLSTPPKA